MQSGRRSVSPVALTQRVKDNILHMPDRLRLHQRISADSKGLCNAGTDWEVVQALRDWAYAHVCEQEEIEATLDQREDFAYAEADAPTIFTAFEQRLGGVWCGGIGQALHKLYGMYGYTSFVLDCGASQTGSTHISNLVRIEHRGRALWTVQDAYYGVTYVDMAGDPLDVLAMLWLLDARRHDQVIMRSGPRNARPLLALGDEASLRMSWRISPPYPVGQPEHVLADGRLMFCTRPSVDALIAHGRADNLFEVLRCNGYPEQLVYLYCLVFAVYPSDSLGSATLLGEMQQCRTNNA